MQSNIRMKKIRQFYFRKNISKLKSCIIELTHSNDKEKIAKDIMRESAHTAYMGNHLTIRLQQMEKKIRWLYLSTMRYK